MPSCTYRPPKPEGASYDDFVKCALLACKIAKSDYDPLSLYETDSGWEYFCEPSREFKPFSDVLKRKSSDTIEIFYKTEPFVDKKKLTKMLENNSKRLEKLEFDFVLPELVKENKENGRFRIEKALHIKSCHEHHALIVYTQGDRPRYVPEDDKTADLKKLLNALFI